MTRILARLRDYGTMGLDPKVLTWSQRVCEQVEDALDKVNAEIGALTEAQAAMAQALASAKTAVVIDPVSDVIVYADYTGTPKSGELPRDVPITASLGTSDITADGTWAVTTTDGVTCTIGAATGVLNITALDVSEVFVPITFTDGSVERPGVVHIVRKDDAPSNTGGTGSTGGTTATTTNLGATTGTTYDTTNSISDTLTVTAGTNGQVACTAPISFRRSSATALGSSGAIGKWQWRVPAGVWADVDTDVAQSSYSVTSSGGRTSGALTVNQTKTGLTSGSSYEFRFLWERVDASGTASNVYRYDGTMTATGS